MVCVSKKQRRYNQTNIWIWMCTCMLSHVHRFVTPWIVTLQAPLSLEFSRWEYWSGLPFSIPVINLTSLALPALVGRFFLPLCQLVSPFELYLRLCEPFKHYSEKAMAPNSTTLAWKIPWTEEPGRLQSMGSRKVGHDWATSLSLFIFMHWRRKWQPTSVFLPGESLQTRYNILLLEYRDSWI